MKAETRNAILDILYPRNVVCALCDREAALQNGVCRACAPSLRSVPDMPRLRGVEGYTAGLLLTPAVRSCMHAFKYGRKTWLSGFFASHMTIPADWTVDVIVPVPLYVKRLAWRGFNQSELLALELGERYGLPVEALLLRVRVTNTQTALSAAQRAKNVKDAFAATDCGGKRVLLIDDVRTTGSTLCACAEALRKAGASAVYAMTATLAQREEDSI